ncbi:MAG: pantoate--beta-alanine ligase [Zetaproteobacteria bacterium CG06_land_8_20_14_3_00_59_53]|nr:MAG: pantoate--beta-alanine ligase [Zetaproteobacteria bacterium CG2_30_59_37]PIO89322.1 MAG: pantoate--beta-alanine ligase [Zetaproteobacteria bacterium CG23_combo_of_CG06-09_8_20_14_all_59_86]PIQ65604.1 MAG: pantoate--beta-alanine ligase [Zetaproteobacteria bacterium CG11_big_fil_rev_8_21_14_0_20_59_439]PIU70621.1 MAG: pantoate--beta-alanine ligase [Zetaproteobacteria bacterium CG06_land_8_20_14_3_00_59_53]PIU98111.1 MAG: pantoate--beta-alanine ligase [Zetaproteobacteria bacterium CG03_lan
MKVATSTPQLRAMLAAERGKRRIVLVPTMGCLHEGHATLIREARKLGDLVVVSIYVNPLQFGPNEDFARYPRSFEADAGVCDEAGADVIFHPENLYPDGAPKVSLTVHGLSDVLCGASRPGHFDGVATVVNILFNAVGPDIAVFGEKDWQQLAIIRRMVADLHMPVEIVGVPTVREAGGLAMSSRNRYLDKQQLLTGRALHAALESMRLQALTGEHDAAVLLDAGKRVLAAAGISPEYLEIRVADSLESLTVLDGSPARAFVAARIGPARLIDNIPIARMTETPCISPC